MLPHVTHYCWDNLIVTGVVINYQKCNRKGFRRVRSILGTLRDHDGPIRVVPLVAWRTGTALSLKTVKKCILMKWLECIGNGKATRAPPTGTAPLPIYRPAGAPHYATIYHCQSAKLCHTMPQGKAGAPHCATVYLSEGKCIPHQFNHHALIHNIQSRELINTSIVTEVRKG